MTTEEPIRIHPPSRLGNTLRLPMAVVGLLICLTAVFLEFSPLTIAAGFAGFLMFVYGGITYLTGNLD